MMTSCRGVRAYLKFHQEHSVTCHWLLIYSLERPILFLLHRFLLTVALLTTSVNESVYNYDCWWPMTQTWRVCHYVNIKVMHRDAGMEGRAVATPPPPSTLDTYIQTQVLPCVFIARNDKTLGQLMLLWLIKAIFDHSRQCQFLIWPKSDDEATTRQVHIYNSTFLASLVVTNTIFFFFWPKTFQICTAHHSVHWRSLLWFHRTCSTNINTLTLVPVWTTVHNWTTVVRDHIIHRERGEIWWQQNGLTFGPWNFK